MYILSQLDTFVHGLFLYMGIDKKKCVLVDFQTFVVGFIKGMIDQNSETRCLKILKCLLF